MEYNVEKKSAFKNFCLKLRLKRLESQRREEICNFILKYPGHAAKMDNIETRINSDSLKKIDFKIKAIRRLIEQSNKN